MAFLPLHSQNTYQKYSSFFFFLLFLPLTAFTLLFNSSCQLSSTQTFKYIAILSLSMLFLQVLLHLIPLTLQFCPLILHFVRKSPPSFCLPVSHSVSYLPFLILQLPLKALLLVSSLCTSPHTHVLFSLL